MMLPICGILDVLQFNIRCKRVMRVVGEYAFISNIVSAFPHNIPTVYCSKEITNTVVVIASNCSNIHLVAIFVISKASLYFSLMIQHLLQSIIYTVHFPGIYCTTYCTNPHYIFITKISQGTQSENESSRVM